MLPVWLRVILGALAVYRLAQFIILDDGPFDLLFALRDKLGRYDLGDDNLPKSGVGRWLACYHCIAKWLAVPAGFAVIFPTIWGDVILAVLGLAGLATILELKFKRPR